MEKKQLLAQLAQLRSLVNEADFRIQVQRSTLHSLERDGAGIREARALLQSLETTLDDYHARMEALLNQLDNMSGVTLEEPASG